MNEKIIAFGKNKPGDIDTGGTFVEISYDKLIDKSLKELAGLKSNESIDGIILKNNSIKIKISKSDKIDYLVIDYTDHEDCKSICMESIVDIIDILNSDSYLELDGSIDKHDGDILSGGLLYPHMPFLLQLKQNGNSEYCKCKLSKSHQGEDSHWIDIKYIPYEIEEITAEEFFDLKEDIEFCDKY